METIPTFSTSQQGFILPFNFLVRRLRASPSEWCVGNGGGEVCIYYLFLNIFILFLGGIGRNHSDRVYWIDYMTVSAVSCQLKKSVFRSRMKTKNVIRTCRYFLTASYDGQIRYWYWAVSYTQRSAPITSLCIISGSYTIATSSHDLTVQLSQFTICPERMDIENTTPSTSISTSKPLASLHLYTASVSSNLTRIHLLTSSWDGLIGLWDTSIPSSDEVQEPVLNGLGRYRKKKEKTRRFSRKAR